MHVQIITDLVSKIGVPAAVLFYVLYCGNKNQRDLINTLLDMKESLCNLTNKIHDTLLEVKKGR